jgi:hypothetical protein
MEMTRSGLDSKELLGIYGSGLIISPTTEEPSSDWSQDVAAQLTTLTEEERAQVAAALVENNAALVLRGSHCEAEPPQP